MLRRVAPALALFFLACTTDFDGDDLARGSQAIIDGTTSPAEQDFVVQISVRSQRGTLNLCTGTLIAKNLVLTARHCTGNIDTEAQTVEEIDPSAFVIFTGPTASVRAATGTPDASVTRIISVGPSLSPDLALFLLDTDLSAPIAPIRLDSGAVKDEALDIVGFGQTESGADSATRLQRRGLRTVRVAPESTSRGPLEKGQFQVGEGACRGDSGGPALSAGTGAVVGVASAVINSKGDSTDAASADFCMGSTAEVVYTDLTPFAQKIREAFVAANATPFLEGEVSPGVKAADDGAPPAATAPATTTTKASCSASSGPSSTPAFGLVLALAGSLLARARFRARRGRDR